MYRFKELREEKGILLEELSVIMNTNPSTMSRIENGLRDAKSDYLERYARYFNVSIDYLMMRTDIRNEKVIKDAIHGTLIKYGYTGKAGEEKEIAAILEKTLEIYKMKRGL